MRRSRRRRSPGRRCARSRGSPTSRPRTGGSAYAKTHTLEEVEKEAALCKKGEQPREDRKGLPEVRFDVRLRVSALLHEQYLLARQKLGADVGRDVTDEEFAGAVLESFLRKPAEGNAVIGLALSRRPRPAPRREEASRSGRRTVPIDLGDAARRKRSAATRASISEDGSATRPSRPADLGVPPRAHPRARPAGAAACANLVSSSTSTTSCSGRSTDRTRGRT